MGWGGNGDAGALTAYLEWLSRRPVRVVAACLAVTVLLAVGASRVRVHVDIDANLPRNHPYVEADREIQEEFGGRNLVAIAALPAGGSVWTPEALGLLVELTDAVLSLPGVDEGSVFSIAAPKVKDIRGTEEGLEVRRILVVPPADDDGARAVRDAFERNRSMLGPLVSRDGRTAGVFFEFFGDVEDEKAYRRTRALVTDFQERHPDAELYFTGRPMFAHYFTENARRTFHYFFLALAVIMVALYVAFRSLQGMVIPVATGILSTLWGLGAMGRR